MESQNDDPVPSSFSGDESSGLYVALGAPVPTVTPS